MTTEVSKEAAGHAVRLAGRTAPDWAVRWDWCRCAERNDAAGTCHIGPGSSGGRADVHLRYHRSAERRDAQPSGCAVRGADVCRVAWHGGNRSCLCSAADVAHRALFDPSGCHSDGGRNRQCGSRNTIRRRSRKRSQKRVSRTCSGCRRPTSSSLEFKAVNGLARLERGQLRRMLVAGAPLRP